MRVVETDNYDGDYPDESFLSEPGLSEYAAKQLADDQNSVSSNPRFWKVVPDDYVLSPGFEP